MSPFRLEQIGATFRKQENPACAVCGYDAEWILRIGEPGVAGTIERMFCKSDLRDALLDAVNFSCAV